MISHRVTALLDLCSHLMILAIHVFARYERRRIRDLQAGDIPATIEIDEPGGDPAQAQANTEHSARPSQSGNGPESAPPGHRSAADDTQESDSMATYEQFDVDGMDPRSVYEKALVEGFEPRKIAPHWLFLGIVLGIGYRICYDRDVGGFRGSRRRRLLAAFGFGVLANHLARTRPDVTHNIGLGSSIGAVAYRTKYGLLGPPLQPKTGAGDA